VVLGNWLSLPTLQIQEEEDEAANSGGARVAGTAMADGVNVEVVVHPRMWNEWKTYPALSQAVQSSDKVAQYLSSHLKMKIESENCIFSRRKHCLFSYLQNLLVWIVFSILSY